MSDISSVPSRTASPVHLSPPDNLPTARPYRFTWDPASRRPGPESVSGTTEGRGGDDFAAAPHPMGFLNHSTTTLALGSLPAEWSSSRTGFHAISTVLNNPHKKQAPPKAHSSLPPVPPADLPRVKRKDFDSYLKAIAPEWERYEHNMQLGRDGQAQIEDSQWTPRNSFAGGETLPEHTQSTSVQGKYIPPLDSVPDVFFRKEFNLGDPKTFANVTEQDTTIFHDDTDPLSLSHSLPLLEKFSHYADTVEQHLVREISIRSTSFFAALTNLHDLQSESERCLDRISKLRTQLQDVDNSSAKRGLEMVRKESKMANLGKVRDGVKMIAGVVEMTGVAKGMVAAAQWGEALDIIQGLEKLWQGGELQSDLSQQPKLPPKQRVNGRGPGASPLLPTPEEEAEGEEGELATPAPGKSTNKFASLQHSVPLSSLQAFSALPSHLRTLTTQIAASLSSELVSVLRNDLELRVQHGSLSANDQGLKDRLKPLLLNLVRTKGMKEGVLSWREVVLVEMRGIIKKILPAFDPEEDDTGTRESEAKSSLANQLRTMSHSTFVALIQDIYQRLLNGIQGLQNQGNIIIEVFSTLGAEQKQSLVHIPALEEDLADIVSSSAELSNTQAARVISLRAEQHAALDLAEFLTFFNDSWAFVIKSETISRRMIVGLRGTVVGQAKVFLQAFHQTRLTKSAKLVEDELWAPIEVTPGLQQITNIIIDCAMRDHPDLIIRSEDAIFSPAPTATSFASPLPSAASGPLTGLPSGLVSEGTPSITGVLRNGTNGSASSTPAPTHSSKHLRIEERTYFSVSATAEVIALLADYLRVIVNLSMLTTDTMSRVIEFLKSFNSRTCQVVLGAGAMRSAGLKNITAKHLALASQSLSIVFELIPYVREAFRRHLSQKQAVMLVEFDKLKRDYQEHQNEIHSKLVAIMGDRLNAHVKSLKTVNWAEPKITAPPVNPYMEILVKETVTLHKVLSRYLSAPVVEYVMTQVFAAINHRLSEEYGTIELPHQEAKTRLLADAKYLHDKLAMLKNVGAPTGMLETVVTEKMIGRAGSSSFNQGGSSISPPQPLARSNTLTANQRLKGLLSGRASGFLSNTDRSFPSGARTPSPPPVPPQVEKPRSLNTVSRNNLTQMTGSSTSIFGANMSQDQLTNDSSQLSLPMSSSPTSENSGQGFRQVEIPASPNPDTTNNTAETTSK